MANSAGNVLRFPDAQGSGASLIGTDVNSGAPVSISRKARQQGLIHVIGVSGSGKTTALLNLMLQDLRAGRSFALVEPAGDLTTALLATMPENRCADVVLLNLLDCGDYPFGLNMYACPQPRTVTEVAKTASQVMHIFERVWNVGTQTPTLAQVVRNVTRTLIDNRATFAEIPLLLQDEAVRDAMVKNVTNTHTRLFWEAYHRKSGREKSEFTASTLNRVDAYLQDGIMAPIVSQERSTIDFRRIMDEGKVLLVLLSPQLEEISRLIGSMVVAGLLRAAFSRADTPEERRRPFGLYVDEFQHFCTQDFATLIHEARKWRLSPVVLSHQALGQLDEANRAAVAGAVTRIVFRVSPEDSKALAPAYDRTPQPMRVGDDPVRAPTSDVVGHLVHKGHHRVVAAQFTADFLLPLEALIRTMGGAMRPIELGGAMFRLGHAIQGRMLLNDVLSEAQRTGRSDLPIDPLALFMLGAAASQKIPLVFKRELKSVAFSGGFFQGFRDSAEKLGKPQFLTDQEALNRFLTRHGSGFWDWLSSRHVLTPGEVFVRMLRTLREVLAILATEPILTETGVYQPRMQQRTYVDMEGEIANALATMPPYQAKVKLLSGEHVIRTNPAPQGLTGELLEARLRRIKRQMRFLGYTRPAAEVFEEIRKRHERLRASGPSDDPPPTHD